MDDGETLLSNADQLDPALRTETNLSQFLKSVYNTYTWRNKFRFRCVAVHVWLTSMPPPVGQATARDKLEDSPVVFPVTCYLHQRWLKERIPGSLRIRRNVSTIFLPKRACEKDHNSEAKWRALRDNAIE